MEWIDLEHVVFHSKAMCFNLRFEESQHEKKRTLSFGLPV